MDEQTLIGRIWSREEDALQDVERQYGALCKKIISNILSQLEDVEECFNETLFKIWSSIPPNWPENLKAFVCKIARQISIDRYRYLHREKRLGIEIELTQAELSGDLALRDSIESHFDSAAITEGLNQFLSQLDEIDRKIFLRRYWHFESVKEIARIFGMNENTVKTTLYRARLSLKAQLEREGVAL